MSDDFKPGDKVVWSSHGTDDTPGVVERKITEETTLAGRKVKASPEEPRRTRAQSTVSTCRSPWR